MRVGKGMRTFGAMKRMCSGRSVTVRVKRDAVRVGSSGGLSVVPGCDLTFIRLHLSCST